MLKSKHSCEHPETQGIFSSDLNLKLFSQALQRLLFLVACQKVEAARVTTPKITVKMFQGMVPIHQSEFVA